MFFYLGAFYFPIGGNRGQICKWNLKIFFWLGAFISQLGAIGDKCVSGIWKCCLIGGIFFQLGEIGDNWGQMGANVLVEFENVFNWGQKIILGSRKPAIIGIIWTLCRILKLKYAQLSWGQTMERTVYCTVQLLIVLVCLKSSVFYSTATNLVGMFKEQLILQFSYWSCWYV